MRSSTMPLLFAAVVALVGCGDDVAPTREADAADTGADADAALADADGSGDDAGEDAAPSGPIPEQATVEVRLDGVPVADAVVIQGGTGVHYRTGADGRVEVALDLTVEGEIGVNASHPEARTRNYTFVGDPGGIVVIELARYDASDNPDYPFADPGEPSRRNTTGQCGHCHQSINDAWFASPHRTSASNPAVLDLYSGAVGAVNNEMLCDAIGGRWLPGRAPGTGARAMRCYLGDGVLHAFNPGCGEASGCEAQATAFSDCANCHAPGIGGTLADQDLLAARDMAFDYGVSCDVCHHIDRIDLSAPPGVGGRLVITRPSEPGSVALGAGGYQPMTFGPSHDVPNPRMGVVQRDHFRDASLCAGCHQHDVSALAPGLALDAERWPSGALPIQSTYEEWLAGPMADVAMCQDCHMPPQPSAANHADLDRFPLATVGVTGGWFRAPGSQRQHAWFGPRQPESRMLELAAAVFVDDEVVGDELRAAVTVRNVGAGHAIPTGEPMRSLVLSVSARCGDEALVATGGDAIDDVGGALASQDAGGDWSRWPDATPGMVVRVVRRTGDWHAYAGFGPFGDGTFTGAAAGLPVELVVGERTITSVDAGVASFDAPLPSGDVAWLVPAPTPIVDGGAAPWLAGMPGFSFARVTAGADGTRRVPHFVATDVVRDNRLMPQTEWTSTHVFAATCADPVVDARLLYFAYPHTLAAARRWPMTVRVIAEASR